jgi:4-methyl-5(b-hydroxyethyl)-thiazole monophosphate biosynthesis
MPKKVIVLLAEGFEEVEAVTPIDYLRRAGVEVTIAAVGKSKTVTGSHGISVNADTLIGDAPGAETWDAVIIPGGLPGAANLAASAEVGALLKEAASAGKWVCAICAAPAAVLSPLGILAGKKYTCYPGHEEKVKKESAASGALWLEDKVVIDGTLITSRGAGTAGLFAVAIIGRLFGEEEGEKIAQSVLMR